MSSTKKLILATGAFTLVANVGAYAAKKQSSERPNIIFILTDDQRWEGILHTDSIL